MTTDRLTRRSVLGSVGAVSLAPVLHGETDGQARREARVDGPRAVPAFAVHLYTGAAASSGTPGGCWRDVTSGWVVGAQLQGDVQAGRVDYIVGSTGHITRVSTYVRVRTPGGVLVELRDHAERVAGDQSGRLVSRCDLSRDGAQHHALLVARVDTSALCGGGLSLAVFEVS